MRSTYKIVFGKPEGKRPVGRLDISGRIVFKWIWRVWIGFNG
jgi:hypothetical protein